MRKPPRLYAHDVKGMIPRMSWSPHNLYNLIARSTIPQNVSQISFKQVSATMFQQRWKSKRFLRGYHGDWIGERRFRRWFLPTSVPRLEQLKNEPSSSSSSSITESGMTEQERLPVTSLFFRDVERRLDTVLHRCCFARSAREARALIVQGKVKLNGIQNTFAGTLLNPGDLISIEPKSVPMLSEEMASKALARKATEMALKAPVQSSSSSSAESSEVKESTTESAEEKKVEEDTVSAADNAEGESKDVASESVEEKASEPTEKPDKGKAKAHHSKEKQDKDLLLPGVLPFNLPPFAAPFLFVPPYLEVSFTTCSAIYIRHPTITPAQQNSNSRSRQNVLYNSDIPSPYPATSDIFSLAWEMYARDAPRIRSDVRRLRLEARVGRSGLRTARAKDQWRKVLAIRKKRDRESNSSNMQFDDVLLQKTAAEVQEPKSRKRWSKTSTKPISQFIVGKNGGPVQIQKKVLPKSKSSSTSNSSAFV